MPTKTVAMKVEAYNALRKLKRPGESFSDVVMRITSKRESPKLSQILSAKGSDDELPSNVNEAHEILNRIRLG